MLIPKTDQREKSLYPEDLRALVEQGLARFFPASERYSEQIYRAMHYTLFLPAKRFRPVLTLLTYRVFGLDPVDVLPTACAIEYIHTYSLIHDDLPAIDNDDLRRGKPTCHLAFGEDIALLAGDALYAEAFYLISTGQPAADPSVIVQVMAELAEATSVRGMVGGQVADVLFSDQPVDIDILNFIHTNKTGKLISASVRCGAILAGASADQLEALSEYAEHLGLAFQITDDILDLVGDEKMTGKPAGSDLKKKKSTFPGMFGLVESKKRAQDAVCQAIEALKGLGDTSALADMAQFVWQRQS